MGPQTNVISPTLQILNDYTTSVRDNLQDVASDNLLSTDIEHPNLDVAEQVSSPPGELNGSVTKLHSYPYKFREIIEQAKQLAQCGAALDPYPNRYHAPNTFGTVNMECTVDSRLSWSER